MSPTLLAKLLAFKRRGPNWLTSYDTVTLFKASLSVDRFFARQQAERDAHAERLGIA